MAKKFLSDIELDAGLVDVNGNTGTSGQILSSTGSATDWIDQGDIVAGEADKALSLTLTVKNTESVALTKGQVVCAAPTATPPSGNVIEVKLADNNGTDSMPAIGILNEGLDAAGGANDEGEAIMFGRISGINTSAFSVGDEVFVSDTPGGLTATKPTGVKYIQKVGVVMRDDASNGTIEVFGAGRTNDVPTPLYIDHANQRVGIGEEAPAFPLHVSSSESSGNLLFLHNSNNAAGATIRFSDHATSTSQNGTITYRHSDSQSQGGAASFHFIAEPDTALVLGNSTNKGRFVSYSQNSVSEVDYGFGGNVNTGMYSPSSNSVGLVAGGSRKLLVNTDGVTIQNGRLYLGGTVDTNTSSTTALVLNGTEVEKRTLGSAAFTNSGDYVAVTGDTMTGNLDVNADIQGNTFTQAATGNPRNNLGSPTVTEMALFDSQFTPKTTLANDYNDLSDLTFWIQTTSSSAWTEVTTYSDDQKRKFLRTANSSVIIPNNTYKFRVEFRAKSYTFANALYGYWSSNSHKTKVHIYKYNQLNSAWTQHTSSSTEISSWPGHMYLPFSTIAWHETNTTSSGHYRDIRIEFTPTWVPYSGSGTDYSSNNINIYGLEIWGGYPSGRRTPHYYDQNGKLNTWGDFQVSGNAYAPIVYDSNNTSYYLDPASTSELNVLNLAGDLSVGPKNNATVQVSESGGATVKMLAGSIGRVGTYSNHNFIITQNSGDALTIDTSKNATFAGDLTVSGGDIVLEGTGRIQGIDTVSAGTDAANKTYVDNAVAGVAYTHPTHPGDDFSVDTGALTGAVVVSDIDINVTTDTLGHVTDANGTVSTRTLTLADLGYTGDTNANNYTHPTHPGDDINLDTGALTGATVISDLDFNITTDTLGHVTDANATYSTRNLTASDLGIASTELVKNYQNVNYVASDPTSGGSRINYGVGVTVYEGYSGGTNRPHSYDATVQFMPTSGQGFELSADWVSSSTTPLKIRSLRDCCQGWSPWVDVAVSGTTSSGTFSTTGDYRAPIFYDSDNTSYYVNPASTSTSLNAAGDARVKNVYISNSSGSVSNKIWFDNGGIYQPGLYFDGNNPKFIINSLVTSIFHDTYHPNADTWTTARTITIGNTGKTVDGSANVSWSLSEIGAAASSHTHDDRYYTETEMQTFFNRGYISAQSASNLAIGWYTIATNTGNRALGEFQIWDVAGSRHQSVLFNASHHYGTDNSNDITVLANSRFGTDVFRYLRIREGGTYDGAALQVYIDNSTNSVNVAITGANAQSSGWVLKDWIPNATDPGDVDNYSSFTNKCQVDLDNIQNGGIATTGDIFSGGALTQYRNLTTADEGSGNGLDADTLDGQHASAFASSSHNHDSDYVELTGDTMSGPLIIDESDTTDKWLFRVDNNGSNFSGFWSASQDIQLYLRDDAGNVRVQLKPDARSLFYDGLEASILHDSDNTSYYVNPAQTSNLQELEILRNSSTYTVNLTDAHDRAGLMVKSSTAFDSKLAFSSGASSRQYIQALNNAHTTGRDIVLNPYGGNVGIGATSPGQKLQVNGNVSADIYYDRNNTGYFFNGDASKDNVDLTSSGNYAINVLGTISGGHRKHNNLETPEMQWSVGGGTDLNWKKLCDVVISDANYAGWGAEIEITDFSGNFGNAAYNGGELFKGALSIYHRGGSGTTPEIAYANIPYEMRSHVRWYKIEETGQNRYQLQVKSPADFRQLYVKVKPGIGNQIADIISYANDTNGTTSGGTAYASIQNADFNHEFAGGIWTNSSRNIGWKTIYGNLYLSTYYGSITTSTSVYIGGPTGNGQDLYCDDLRSNKVFDRAATAYYFEGGNTGDSIRVAGDVVAYYSSDKRLKDNIKPIENALDKVNAISGVTFEWNEKSHKTTGKKDVGVVAQEVEEVFPELVETRTNGYKAVDYQKLTAVLIESVKELTAKVEALESKQCNCK